MDLSFLNAHPPTSNQAFEGQCGASVCDDDDADSSDAQPPGNKPHLKDVDRVCEVCGDRSSGRHYGAFTCDGCRGFFKRSVRKQTTYRCKETNICTVDVVKRNQCQACRYRKCLEANMKPEAVQHERTSSSHTSTMETSGRAFKLKNICSFGDFPANICYQNYSPQTIVINQGSAFSARHIDTSYTEADLVKTASGLPQRSLSEMASAESHIITKPANCACVNDAHVSKGTVLGLLSSSPHPVFDPPPGIALDLPISGQFWSLPQISSRAQTHPDPGRAILKGTQTVPVLHRDTSKNVNRTDADRYRSTTPEDSLSRNEGIEALLDFSDDRDRFKNQSHPSNPLFNDDCESCPFSKDLISTVKENSLEGFKVNGNHLNQSPSTSDSRDNESDIQLSGLAFTSSERQLVSSDGTGDSKDSLCSNNDVITFPSEILESLRDSGELPVLQSDFVEGYFRVFSDPSSGLRRSEVAVGQGFQGGGGGGGGPTIRGSSVMHVVLTNSLQHALSHQPFLALNSLEKYQVLTNGWREFFILEMMILIPDHLELACRTVLSEEQGSLLHLEPTDPSGLLAQMKHYSERHLSSLELMLVSLLILARAGNRLLKTPGQPPSSMTSFDRWVITDFVGEISRLARWAPNNDISFSIGLAKLLEQLSASGLADSLLSPQLVKAAIEEFVLHDAHSVS